MLNNGKVTANIPAADLDRARAFYADALGLTPTSELAGGVLMYETAGGTTFTIYRTDFAGTAGHTVANWEVDDVDAAVRDLKAKGVAFEQYDMPGVDWNDGVATMAGMGKAAWFKDSEANILCLNQSLPST